MKDFADLLQKTICKLNPLRFTYLTYGPEKLFGTWRPFIKTLLKGRRPPPPAIQPGDEQHRRKVVFLFFDFCGKQYRLYTTLHYTKYSILWRRNNSSAPYYMI